jgi:hypothetical protein
MKRNKIIEALDQEKSVELKKRIAFHEAGHAAGIYLNNKAKQLPAVFFNVIFKGRSGVADINEMAYQTMHDDSSARVQGGRLIEMPPSIDSLIGDVAEHDDPVMQLIQEYMVAFEADIINMLIGPLAEARHVAEVDNEPFSHQLVNLDALKNYGGSSDLILVNDYLHSFSTDKQQNEEILAKLFAAAFDFVNEGANWTAITALAGYILDGTKNTIGYEEIASILEQSVTQFKIAELRQDNMLLGTLKILRGMLIHAFRKSKAYGCRDSKKNDLLSGS